MFLRTSGMDSRHVKALEQTPKHLLRALAKATMEKTASSSKIST